MSEEFCILKALRCWNYSLPRGPSGCFLDPRSIPRWGIYPFLDGLGGVSRISEASLGGEFPPKKAMGVLLGSEKHLGKGNLPPLERVKASRSTLWTDFGQRKNPSMGCFSDWRSTPWVLSRGGKIPSFGWFSDLRSTLWLLFGGGKIPSPHCFSDLRPSLQMTKLRPQI